jgi:hypothetical protein
MNIAGAGRSGQAQATSYDTMGQMNRAFRNIVNMLQDTHDGLLRGALSLRLSRNARAGQR